MSDYLYYSASSVSQSSNSISDASSSIPSNTRTEVTTSNDFFSNINGGWFNGLKNFDLETFNFFDILNTLNYFLLAWVLVHSFLLLLESYLYYFKFAAMDDFLENQETGRVKFLESWELWKDYLVGVILFLIYCFTYKIAIAGLLVGTITSVYYVYAFFFKSLPKTPILDVFQGKDNSIIGRAVQSLKKIAPKSTAKSSSGDKGEKEPGLLGGIVGGLASVSGDVAKGLVGGSSSSNEKK